MTSTLAECMRVSAVYTLRLVLHRREQKKKNAQKANSTYVLVVHEKLAEQVVRLLITMLHQVLANGRTNAYAGRATRVAHATAVE